MRVPCPACTVFVQAASDVQGRAWLALNHTCANVPVDPDNDPRPPRDDAHAERMEAAQLGLDIDQEPDRA